MRVRKEISRWCRRVLMLAGALCLSYAQRLPALDALPGRDAFRPGNVIFLHPDGTSLTAWNIFRILEYGPDGLSQWDQMPALALYRPHLTDSIASTSHGGGTVHAFGVKVVQDSYGQDGTHALRSASGQPYSVMIEAIRAGLATGIVNSGHLAEPGTGTFLASVDARNKTTEIVQQIVESGCHVILGGGEIYFLPEGAPGRHGKSGVRQDGRNLIARAQELGYRVVFTKAELQQLPPNTRKVLGVFAAEATYHPQSHEQLREKGLPAYQPDAPTVADMTAAALRFLEASGKRFFLVAEEEGTDDFPNKLNAVATLEAYRRADAMLGVGRQFVARHEDTLLLTASDSEASGLHALAYGRADAPKAPQRVPATTEVGAPLHGQDGPGTAPFVSGPDREGRRFLFGLTLATTQDMFGGVLARAEGLNAGLLPPHLDNTQIFQMIHRTLFAGGDEGQGAKSQN